MSLQYVLETCWIRLKDLLTKTVQVDDTSWKRLEDIFARCLQNALKTSWRCIEDGSWICMARTNILVLTKTSWRCLEGVFWRRMIKTNIFVLIKTSWRRFLKMKTKDFFKTSLSRPMFAGLLLILIESNYKLRISAYFGTGNSGWRLKKVKNVYEYCHFFFNNF